MSSERIFLGLGSNLGNKTENLKKALNLLKNKGISVIKKSSWYETEPYGYKDQDNFLNGIVETEFSGKPEELLQVLLNIESEMKRERKVHWGPRNIDLDIILYGQKIIMKPELTVPHPDMQNRSFVLEPLAEIAPEIIHPVFQKTILDLLKELKNKNDN